MEFYRVYHMDAKGRTAALTNFLAANDTLACERASVLMAESRWPGIELWESMRQVDCVGVTRGTVDVPDVPAQRLAPSLRPHQRLL